MAEFSDYTVRERAWIGDAVLELFVRKWVMETDGKMDGAKQARFTSNQFLSCFGNPTEVEAKVGDIYDRDGLADAFAWIEESMLPLFLKQETNRSRKQ